MRFLFPLIFLLILITIIISLYRNFKQKNTNLYPASNLTDNKKNTEKCIALLAKKMGNKITIIDVVRECDISSNDAENTLNDLAIRGIADMQVKENGSIVYYFHDAESF